MKRARDKVAAADLTVYLPDTRGVTISRYGRGNLKLGSGVYTYSRLPGKFHSIDTPIIPGGGMVNLGTCPGATEECEAICYAKRVEGVVKHLMWEPNSETSDVPPIPPDCKLLRLHVSGDFDSLAYIAAWGVRLYRRPDVTCWAYTRSWRIPELREALEALRDLPNVQLFASMDISTQEDPPKGWRRAWIDGDPRADVLGDDLSYNRKTFDGTMSLVCPEQTGEKRDCESCRYCFSGMSKDVTFLRH